jgi:hypothetical protein
MKNFLATRSFGNCAYSCELVAGRFHRSRFFAIRGSFELVIVGLVERRLEADGNSLQLGEAVERRCLRWRERNETTTPFAFVKHG